MEVTVGKGLLWGVLPAPTSVLWGSQTAHPTSDQYACSREIASWKVGMLATVGLPVGWDLLAIAAAAAALATADAPARVNAAGEVSVLPASSVVDAGEVGASIAAAPAMCELCCLLCLDARSMVALG